MLSSALHAGFNTVGVDTVDLGIVPVGAVSRLGRDIGARLAVMVSASHNPAEDNGIKFFGPDGAKLSDAREDEIESRYRKGRPWRSAFRGCGRHANGDGRLRRTLCRAHLGRVLLLLARYVVRSRLCQRCRDNGGAKAVLRP